ncbi:hypothetical protein [Flavobacterium sp. H4147]|uniref:hypothetical protein n=1 Tax=Flavobacterium sp. H4147 TaxID=3034149 RepID=UPI0023EAD041|nr:hypothetical protein [Flavobacterium sp. H4147]
MNVYRLSSRLKVFIFLFSVLQILVLSSLLLIPFIDLPSNSRAYQLYDFCCSSAYLHVILLMLIVAAIIVAFLLVINVFKRKVIFTSDSIISKSIFSTQKLIFSDIKGYKIRHSILYIITNSNEKRRLVINLFTFDRTDNLLRNLEMRFTNLDF